MNEGFVKERERYDCSGQNILTNNFEETDTDFQEIKNFVFGFQKIKNSGRISLTQQTSRLRIKYSHSQLAAGFFN